MSKRISRRQFLRTGVGTSAGAALLASGRFVLAQEPTPTVTVGTNVRISGQQYPRRSESDIRVNYYNPNQVIAASNDVGAFLQAQYYSSDGGLTWNQSRLPDLFDSHHYDPAVDWTSDGTAWATTLNREMTGLKRDQVFAFKSSDGGITWTFDARVSDPQTQADRPMLWVDHSASSPFSDNIYAIWTNRDGVFVNRRTGPTGAWQSLVQVSAAETEGEANGADIKTNNAGHIFGFWPDTGTGRMFAAKSLDGGVSFTTPVLIATTFDRNQISVPSFSMRLAGIYISAGAYRTEAKDLVYAIWTDLTGATDCNSAHNEPYTDTTSPCKTRIWFSRSTDGGASWEPPRMINNQPTFNDQFNPRMVVDEGNGELVVIYYDTVLDPGRVKTDLWCQISSDDGVSWTDPVRVTTAQTDETTAGADNYNQYGDYNGISGVNGRFLASWTDRRSDGKEEIWTAVIQTH